MTAEILPSILSADFMRLGEQVSILQDAQARALHVDVMDGVFVPSISFGFPVIDSLVALTNLHLDIHLMIVKPERYLDAFTKYQGSTIVVHAEACEDLACAAKKIRAAGCRAGAAVNPETDCREVFPVLDLLDEVMVMTVHPGFGGQKMMEEILDKGRILQEEIRRRNLSVHLEVDGGVNRKNIRKVCASGFDQIVCGSAVFRGDIRENLRALREALAGEGQN